MPVLVLYHPTSAGEGMQTMVHNEEALYEQVADELMQGEIRRGLWTMALTNAMGDERLAKSFYIRLRVEQLNEEAHIQEELSAQAEAERAAADASEIRMQLLRRDAEAASLPMIVVAAVGVAVALGLLAIGAFASS